MAENIQTWLDRILTARYGEDVRESIYKSIKLFDEEVNDPLSKISQSVKNAQTAATNAQTANTAAQQAKTDTQALKTAAEKAKTDAQTAATNAAKSYADTVKAGTAAISSIESAGSQEIGKIADYGADQRKRLEDVGGTEAEKAVNAVKAQEMASKTAVSDQQTTSVGAVKTQETTSKNAVAAQQTTSVEAVKTQETTSKNAVAAQQTTSVNAVKEAEEDAVQKIGETVEDLLDDPGNLYVKKTGDAIIGIVTVPTPLSDASGTQIANVGYVKNAIPKTAESADKLSTARTIKLTGEVSGEAEFDGSEDLIIKTTKYSVSNGSVSNKWYKVFEYSSFGTGACDFNGIFAVNARNNSSLGDGKKFGLLHLCMTTRATADLRTLKWIFSETSVKPENFVLLTKNSGNNKTTGELWIKADYEYNQYIVSLLTYHLTSSNGTANLINDSTGADTLPEGYTQIVSTMSDLRFGGIQFTPRIIKLTGAMNGEAEFDGSENVNISATLEHTYSISFDNKSNCYTAFARYGNANPISAQLLVTDIGAYSGNAGLYLVDLHKGSGNAFIKITTISNPTGRGYGTIEFGTYESDGMTYIGFYKVDFRGNPSVTVLSLVGAEIGNFHDSATKPTGWTEIPVTKIITSDGGTVGEVHTTVTDPSADDVLVPKKWVDSLSWVPDGAGAHNSQFRGKNLGSSITAAQKQAIYDGTFKDLFIGDYWEIGVIKYRIIDFDYYYSPSSGYTDNTATSSHHIVVMPDNYFHTVNEFNSYGSPFYGNYSVNTALSSTGDIGVKLISTFGADSLFTIGIYAPKYESGTVSLSNIKTVAQLPSESQIMGTCLYGQPLVSLLSPSKMTSGFVRNSNEKQFSLFALVPYTAISDDNIVSRTLCTPSDSISNTSTNSTVMIFGKHIDNGVINSNKMLRPYFVIKGAASTSTASNTYSIPDAAPMDEDDETI